MPTTNLGRIGFVSKGAWAAGTYKNLDVVRYSGALYICKVLTTTAVPTTATDWDLYVEPATAATTTNSPAGDITATDVQAAINELDTEKVKITTVVAATTQDWDGVSYTDPDAVGANPTAKIYPDGSVVGSTDNGSYTKYANGDLECYGTSATITGGDVYGSTGLKFNSTPLIIDLPMAFTTTAEMSALSNTTVHTTANSWGDVEIFNTTSLKGYIWSGQAAATAKLSYIVTGKWK